MTSALQRLLPALVLAGSINPAFGEPPASPIRDDAKLFHTDAITRAEQRIDEIHRTFERNLFVQTVATADPHQWRLFRFLRTPQVNRMLEEQARKRAQEVGTNGIYVVICNDPRDVHVIVQPEEDPEFTPHDAEELRRTMARRLHESGPDTALLALVNQVHATLLAHATRGQSRSVVSEFTLAGILSGGLGLWLALYLIRHRMRVANKIVDENTPEQAQRTPALLGALFGCPAALPIYDKLFPCPSSGKGLFCEPEQPAVAEDEHGDGRDAAEQPIDEQAEDAPISP
jgi:hypothetical protein